MPLYLNTSRDRKNKERFNMSLFIPYENDHYDTLDSYFIEQLSKLNPKGIYVVGNEELRPDLISKKIYGTEFLAWVLMQYNNIQDFTTIRTGQELSYPSLDALNNLLGSLRNKQRST